MTPCRLTKAQGEPPSQIAPATSRKAVNIPKIVLIGLQFPLTSTNLVRATVQLDDFSHGHAQMIFNQYHLTAGDEPIVDVNIDRFAYFTV